MLDRIRKVTRALSPILLPEYFERLSGPVASSMLQADGARSAARRGFDDDAALGCAISHAELPPSYPSPLHAARAG